MDIRMACMGCMVAGARVAIDAAIGKLDEGDQEGARILLGPWGTLARD